MELNGYEVSGNAVLDNLRSRANRPGQINEKICPFQSSADKQVACSPQCQLYRSNKGEYFCPMQELTSIAWFLNQNRKY